MEEPQSAQSAHSGKLLRYALRSGTKSKEEKPPVAAAEPSPNNSAAKRGRPASNMSKSVGSLQLRYELKSYVDRYELSDLEDPLKELLESKSVAVNEQAQVSETCSQVLEEGTRSSDDDAKSCSSTMASGKLKPKSLNIKAAQVSPEKATAKKEISLKSTPAARTRSSSVKSTSNSGPVSDNGARVSTVKKPQKPNVQDSNKVKDRKKKQGNQTACEQDSINPATEGLQENKENQDAPSTEAATEV
ncbi:hypothetical protein C1H46_022407 [Malus baccata]|uniref:Uncharacterized protein n=1 Tax=Malus baccata TaxID=106549 RepID=A0A540LZU4_MALBA|nr:hypothetical protein C1H46_022407 [Malus baccata]